MSEATIRYSGPDGLATPDLAPYQEGGSPLPFNNGDELVLPLRAAQGICKRTAHWNIVKVDGEDPPVEASPPAPDASSGEPNAEGSHDAEAAEGAAEPPNDGETDASPDDAGAAGATTEEEGS